MLGPLDVQVLANRTLEVQKMQGVAVRQHQNEEEMAKNRLDQEIEKNERQVRRKDLIIDGRVNDKERKQENNDSSRHQQKKNQEDHGLVASGVSSEREPQKAEFRGQIVDIEV